VDFSEHKRVVLSVAACGLLLVGLFLHLAGASQSARAGSGDLFVTPGGDGDCSQGDPCDLQTALGLASNGGTVYVASGVHTGTGAAVVTVTRSITLYGGWDGTTTTPVLRDPDAYPTTLDGEDARRVLYIRGDITPTVAGFIVTGGNATGLAEGLDGWDAGGGIYIEDASPTIVGNTIADNVASAGSDYAYGGGIYLSGDSAPAMVSGNLIAHNAANLVDTGRGGGLAMRFSGPVTVSDNVFQDNTAGVPSNSMGGGVYLDNSPALVSGNLLQGNRASSTGEGFGGALYTELGAVTLSGNTIISNAAEYGAVTVEHTTNVTLTNNIVAQNPAGGVFVRGSASYPLAGVLAHNTIAQNGREGVYAGWYNSGYATLTLTNNIVVSHTTGIYAHQHAGPNVVTATNTLFYGNDDDTDGPTITSTDEITGSDPLFVNPDRWNYHVWPDSPAIDAGTDVLWLTTDVDGDARPWPTGGNYDIGADEARWWQVYLPLTLRGSG
jgi:hypothetical protein